MRLAPALLALSLGACALRPLYVQPLPKEAEVLRARTADGWEISMIRYHPSGKAKGRPVLLCHGISANGRNMDLDEGHSLARYFAAQGRESFAISLRGTGESDHADPSLGRPWQYTLDTFAEQDIPAAIAKITGLTGAAQVDFVGHSMGGLVAYDYLARGSKGMHAVIVLGSPARFLWGGGLETLLGSTGPVVAKNLDTIPTPTLAYAVMPLHGEIEGPIELMLFNPDNVNTTTWKRLIAVGLGTISGGVLRQFATWIEKDVMTSADGLLDFRKELPQVKTPVFVVAGKFDRIAPVPAVKAGYELMGGPREFFIAGEENGFAHDYGHMDMVVGDRAELELWPRLERFLEQHDR